MADDKKTETVRVKILTSGALVNTEDGTRAGLYDEVDVEKDRAAYLVSVGAAAPIKDDDAQKLAEIAPPTGGATATDPGEAERLKAEQEAAVERREAEEREQRARRQPRTAAKAPAKKADEK
ncbi:hypothetical protein SEA_BOGOTA_17 [Streptomyces phage Bogota]|nr:hypothetical protein SEA_UNTPL_17 [Streptomyces phage UNTPL]WIC89167.1 hypothetical protein SEA_BOGOTA_17 [Streptomyces phage Bogota]